MADGEKMLELIKELKWTILFDASIVSVLAFVIWWMNLYLTYG